MSSLAARQLLAKADQRRVPRFAVDIPVTLRTVSGNRECQMANISVLGAMLELASPPCEGISVCIICSGNELYGRVVWSNDGACGVEFERVLAEHKLTEIAGEQSDDTGPVANVGNIQMGRKRGRLVSGS